MTLRLRGNALLPVLLAAALAAAAPAAIAAPSIPLPWQAGTRLEYESTTVDEKVARGVRRVTTTRADTTVAITQASDTGFVQEWRDTHATVAVTGDGPDNAGEQRLAQAMLDGFDGLALEATLDAQGLFTGVRNWEPLGARMRAVMLPVMRTQARTRPELAAMPDAELDAKLAPTLARMTTQAVIDASLGKQASIYNLFTAPAVVAGTPIRYEDVLQSPVSAHQIPAVGMFELTDTDEAADTITIRWTQSIDPQKGAEVAWKMVEAITGTTMPVDRAKLPPDLVLRDEATVTLHRTTGVPQRVMHQRRIDVGGQSKSTTWTLVLKPGAAR